MDESIAIYFLPALFFMPAPKPAFEGGEMGGEFEKLAQSEMLGQEDGAGGEARPRVERVLGEKGEGQTERLQEG